MPAAWAWVSKSRTPCTSEARKAETSAARWVWRKRGTAISKGLAAASKGFKPCGSSGGSGASGGAAGAWGRAAPQPPGFGLMKVLLPSRGAKGSS